MLSSLVIKRFNMRNEGKNGLKRHKFENPLQSCDKPMVEPNSTMRQCNHRCP
jgi:hypothetical protein